MRRAASGSSCLLKDSSLSKQQNGRERRIGKAVFAMFFVKRAKRELKVFAKLFTKSLRQEHKNVFNQKNPTGKGAPLGSSRLL